MCCVCDSSHAPLAHSPLPTFFCFLFCFCFFFVFYYVKKNIWAIDSCHARFAHSPLPTSLFFLFLGFCLVCFLGVFFVWFLKCHTTPQTHTTPQSAPLWIGQSIELQNHETKRRGLQCPFFLLWCTMSWPRTSGTILIGRVCFVFVVVLLVCFLLFSFVFFFSCPLKCVCVRVCVRASCVHASCVSACLCLRVCTCV